MSNIGNSTRGLGYRHRPPSLGQRAASAWRSRRVSGAFEPFLHPPFPELFLRFGPLDQGELNACTGFGVAMGATLQAALGGAKRSVALSPRLPYWAARRREAGADELVTDEGAFVDDVVWAFNAFGATDDQPHMRELTASTVNQRPPASDFRAALAVRSELELRMRAIVASGDRLVQRLAHSLNRGQVCFVALPVTESFFDAGPGPDAIGPQPLERALGYHFVCLLDWRRTLRDRYRYELLCGNSWGWRWGDSGMAWLSPELVAQSLGACYLERSAP
jgi:hypothetical protein